MNLNRLHIRYVFQDKLDMPVVRFLFKIMKYFQDIIIYIHTIAAIDFNDGIRRDFIQREFNFLFIQETHVQCQFQGVMRAVPFGSFLHGKTGPVSMFDKKVNAVGHADQNPNEQIGKEDGHYRDDKRKKLFPALFINAHDHGGLRQVIPGADEDNRQGAIRNQINHGDTQQQHQ